MTGIVPPLRRHSAHWWLRRVAVVAASVAVGFAVYQGVEQGPREATQLRHGLEHENAKLRADNAALCDYFRTEDKVLGKITGFRASTAAGAAIEGALGGLQLAARKVTTSALCVPPEPPPGSRHR